MEGGFRLQLFLLVLIFCHSQCIKILHSFRDPGGNILQKLVIDDQTGSVFLGALNRLHKLDPDLNIVQSASTGPRLDNVECPPPLLPCDKPKTQLNSQIKGLVIDSASNSLILCSSLFHGSCQTLALNNITNVKKFFHKPLVPNDHHSCYMFLAPSINDTEALYIATAYSDLGKAAYRDLVPSLSSRSLENLDFIHRDTEGATKLEILKEYRESFIVRQLYGFHNGGFVYFITLQRENPDSQKIVSRINRLCQKDKYFRSFVEIPIKCQKTDADSFDVVQSAYFNDGKLYVVFSNTVSSAGAKKSTFCEYDIEDIDSLFNETVQTCYDGVGYQGPAHYKKRQLCYPLIFGSVDFCGGYEEAQDYAAIEGSKPISSTPLHLFTTDKPTAIFVQPEGQDKYVYIGTQDGHVLKLRMENDQVTTLFKVTHSVGDIILDITNHPQSNLLYILSSHKLSVLSLNHCDDLTSCDDCMTNGDETCGWCVMDNRCSTKELCQSSVITPPWLSKTDQSCASISSLQPTSVSYKKFQNGDNSKQIKFQVDKLKFTSDKNLNCLFVNDGKQHNTAAILDQTENTITCPLPQELPSIPQGKDHEDLELQFHVQGKMIVKRDVSVFDCQGNNNCTSCSTSKFNCHWCPVSHSCVEQTESCPQGNSIKVSDRCPRLETAASDTDILVHSGELKTISVQVRALQANQRTNLKCHFDLSGQIQTVSAKISSSTLTCETIKLAYADDIPYIVAGFKVTWGPQNQPLDNPQQMNVRIYKCASMVTNCGKCLSLDVEYECGWCEDQCSLQKKCSKSWLDQSETCPNPQILRYSPSKGPIKGKTEIQVNGINLGKEISDILGRVTVADLPCLVIPDHYEPSSSFKCEVKGVTSAKSGVVKVVVNKKYLAESDTAFEFVDPVLSDIEPKKGLMSGGTRVLIKGNNLDIGSDTQVIVGGNSVPVIKSNLTTIEFKTPKKTSNRKSVTVEVDFGGYRKKVPGIYTYTKDPTITMIEPKRSILSGGTTITVVGTHLNMIQEPKFFTTYGGKIYSNPCSKQNELMLYCTVPGINAMGVNVTDTNPLEVHYGFDMDQVDSLRNISHQPAFGPMLYFPDPSIYKFNGDDSTKKYNKDDLLSIQGQFRSVNPLMSNVVVYVGSEECINTASTDSAITCEPPVKPVDIDNGKAVVQLQIGNLKTDVGYLQYYEVENNEKPIALGIILGVVLPIIAIIALLAFCVIKKHRKHGPSDSYIPDVLKDYEGQKEEEEIGLNHVSVKADMNGLIEDKDSGPYISELLSKFEDAALRQNITSLLVPRSKLDVGELIGKGNFGAVYKAQYQRSAEEKQVQVAVKTLQCKVNDSETIQTFLQDTVVLKDLQHSNILPLVGVCITVSDDPLIIMPFMATEDLKSYIREPSKNLTVLELLDFACQIVKGMVYLEDVKVIHRNLAARNCIVSEDKKIQLTDCGITKTLFNKEYYTATDSVGKSLMKWLAPETIENFIFSHKSDVWAYGVVLWELLTRGVTPYPDVDSNDLVQYLDEGKRMKKPKQCTQPIYDIMLKCWSQAPNDRPTFSQLDSELQTLVSSEDKSTSSDETRPLMNSVDIGGSTEYLEMIG